MTLEQTLKEIKTLIPFAEEDVETGDPATLNGRRGRKIQSMEQISRLKRDYKNELLKTAVFIVVYGSERGEFEKIATNDRFGLFSANPEDFYNDLAARIPPVVYQGKESVSNVFDILGRHLEDKMNEIGVLEYNQLVFKEAYVGTSTTQAEFTKLVKRAVNDQMGAEVVGIQAVNSIMAQAISRNHSGKTTPIILGTDDLSLVMSLHSDLPRLSDRVFFVKAGEITGHLAINGAIPLHEVNGNTVKSALATINKTIKK